MHMTTIKEVWQAATEKFPQHKITAWHWISSSGYENIHLDAGEHRDIYSAQGKTMDEVLAKFSPPPIQDEIQKKREMAAKLLAEAAELEAAKNAVPSEVTEGEAGPSFDETPKFTGVV